MTYTKETETAVFRAALAKWGAHAQSIVALEELAELQKEICKQERGGGDVNHLAEEARLRQPGLAVRPAGSQLQRDCEPVDGLSGQAASRRNLSQRPHIHTHMHMHCPFQDGVLILSADEYDYSLVVNAHPTSEPGLYEISVNVND
jgi:hypothetical protein